MSYSCTISFKTISADEIYSFFQQIKKACIDNIESFAKENYAYSPPFKRCSWKPIEIDYTEEFCELEKSIETWAKNSIFKFRWFYLKDLNLLGVYTDDESLKPLFDCTVYFQNSCDQDYERREWEGIDAFTKIFDRWHSYSNAYVKRAYRQRYHGSFNDGYEGYTGEKLQQKIDYYRRSFAYDDIWEQLSSELYCEEESIFFSVYGNYEIREIIAFVKYCHAAHVAWEEEFEREWKANHPEKE
jgi:hypothetical protein